MRARERERSREREREKERKREKERESERESFHSFEFVPITLRWKVPDVEIFFTNLFLEGSSGTRLMNSVDVRKFRYQS